jgi:hypothetical protein
VVRVFKYWLMMVYNFNECHCPQLRWLKVEDTHVWTSLVLSHICGKSQICGQQQIPDHTLWQTENQNTWHKMFVAIYLSHIGVYL